MTDIDKFTTLMNEFGIEMSVCEHEKGDEISPAPDIQCSAISLNYTQRDGCEVKIDNSEGILMCPVFVFEANGRFVGAGATDWFPVEFRA